MRHTCSNAVTLMFRMDSLRRGHVSHGPHLPGLVQVLGLLYRPFIYANCRSSFFLTQFILDRTMRRYTDVYGRMWTYVDVCGRMCNGVKRFICLPIGSCVMLWWAFCSAWGNPGRVGKPSTGFNGHLSPIAKLICSIWLVKVTLKRIYYVHLGRIYMYNWYIFLFINVGA